MTISLTISVKNIIDASTLGNKKVTSHSQLIVSMNHKKKPKICILIFVIYHTSINL